MNDYPFEGLLVVDFGVGAVGVEVTRLFGEYGADVVKVESYEKPDFMRQLTPNFINPSFASSSRSSRSVNSSSVESSANTFQRRKVLYSPVCK